MGKEQSLRLNVYTNDRVKSNSYPWGIVGSKHALL